MASLNVPYANDVPVLTPVEAIGQWQQINHQKTMEDLAQQQERRLGQQAEREQKSGDLKYQMDAHNALKQVMTDFKSSLERRAKELKLSPNSPEYQQLANAMYSNNYDKTVFNITGKAHDPKTNIDLNAVNSLVDMTPTEKLDYELHGKKAELDLMQPYKLEIAQAQAGINQASQQRQFQQQMQMAQLQNQFANQRDDRNFQQQYARDLQNRNWQIEDFEKETEAKRELQKDLIRLKAETQQEKPLPSPIVKEQQKLREQIGIASSINADLGDFVKKLEDGTLNLSLIGNISNKARNYLGLSNDESSNLASFNASLEKVRNDSLRLNSGVQTEGDAQRAWNELFANINDEKVVKDRLKQIQAINQRAIDLKINDINAMRSEYGKEEIDAGQFNVKGAINQKSSIPMPENGDEQSWNDFLKLKGLK